MRGENAAGGQSFPPQWEGQNVAGLPTPGFLAVGESRVWIVGPRDPHGHPAGLPGIPRPGLAPRFAGGRYGVGLPGEIPVLGVQRRDETADAELAPGNAHQHLAGGSERGEGHVVARAVVFDFGFPDHRAGHRVECDDVAVGGRHVHQVSV